MTVLDELAKHIGHRATLIDTRRLRCIDCAQTVQLPTGLRAVTSPPEPPGRHTARCDRHPNHGANGCAPCRSERLADESRTVPPTPSTPEGRKAARDALAAALGASPSAAPTTEETG